MSEQRMIEPGTILGGRYEVGDLIGRSDMAEVYRGTDTTLGRTVAIKVLSSEFAQDENFVSRFLREAATASKLEHQHIAAVYDSGSDEGRHFVVMEYVEGQTLAQVIEKDGKLAPDRAITIAEAACDALAYAHGQGVLHQDIRPGNIMITGSGDVKVMDLGIRQTTAIETAAQMGTATYLSPEQARGERTAEQSDVYSLGVVLYEMVTGRPPFSGSSPVAVAFQHAREEPKPPSELNPDLPAGLEELILRILSKRPSERPSAADLKADLERIGGGRKTPLAPAPTPPAEEEEEVTAEEKASPEEKREEAAAAADARAGAEAEAAAKKAEEAPTEIIETSGVEPATMVLGGRGAGARKINPRMLAAGIAAAVVIAAAVFFLVLRSSSVTVPNLVGANVNEATKQLQALGLEVKTIASVTNEQPAGTVLNQAPAAGSNVNAGTSVILTVAQAETTKTVPNVVNLTQADAQAALEEAGFLLGTIDQQPSPNVAPGLVISQDPPAGTAADAGTAVNIVVSEQRGPVTVPNVTCVRLNLGATQLQEAGLLVTIAGQEANDLCPTTGNYIARQDPIGGSTVKAGTVVSVWTTQSISPSPGAPVSPGGSPASPAIPTPGILP